MRHSCNPYHTSMLTECMLRGEGVPFVLISHLPVHLNANQPNEL